MDEFIKKKVLDWIDHKITEGKTQFILDDCVTDIGLNPLDKQGIDQVEEIFQWHQSIIHEITDICFEINT